MSRKILLTSFDTWLPHQSSNTSDDLLQTIPVESNLIFLRKLPVNIIQASQRVISFAQNEHPDLIICCGMAESRKQLTLESHACQNTEKLYTPIDIISLVTQLSYTKISYDAGKFVCEGLYYHILKYCSVPSLFVHVPILNQNNLREVKQDFQLLIKLLSE